MVQVRAAPVNNRFKTRASLKAENCGMLVGIHSSITIVKRLRVHPEVVELS